MEKYLTAKHSLNFFNNVGVSALYYNPKLAGSLKPLVYRALADLIAQHPSLSAIPVDDDKSHPYFVQLPQINLPDVVIFRAREKVLHENDQTDAELDAILQEQHNTNFKQRYGELPFWRLVILYEPHCMSRFVASFIFHHALADGTSGLAFHRSFHSRLSQLTSTDFASESGSDAVYHEDTCFVVKPSDKPLLPNLEALHSLPVSPCFILKALIRDWFPPKQPEIWRAMLITNSPSKCHCGFQSFSIPSKTTSALVQLSRAHSTTLTGTVEAVMVAALFANLPSEYTSLSCDGAISLRRWLPRDIIDEDSIGAWVSLYIQVHHRPEKSDSEEFLWNEAKKVRTTIESELNRKGKNTVAGLLPYAGDFHTLFKRHIGKAREHSFEFSNIGVFKPAQQDGVDSAWKVGRMVFSQSADVVGAALEVSIVTGGDGCLTVGISWMEGIVEGKWLQNVIEEFRSIIEKLAA